MNEAKAIWEIEAAEFSDKPHGWIQWKGTDVCIDLHCSCGALLHYDGDFLYHWICPHCKRMWKMGAHIPMYEVPKESQEQVNQNECVATVELDHEECGSQSRIARLQAQE